MTGLLEELIEDREPSSDALYAIHHGFSGKTELSRS